MDKDKHEKEKRPLRIPGFVNEEIGLGDVLQKFTNYIGIKPCGGCNQRAQWLNHKIAFKPRNTP